MTISSNRSPFKVICLFALIVLLAGLPLIPASQVVEWNKVSKNYVWSFPRDHWAHPEYRTEWWYFTGHLESVDNPVQKFAYQFTFFRVGLAPQDPGYSTDWSSTTMIMGHAAITDTASGRHLFSEVVYRESPHLGGFNEYPAERIAWCRAPAGTDGFWELKWNGQAFDFSMIDSEKGFQFSLETRPEKPLIFQGVNGYSPKTADGSGASLYYSFTRLKTEGKLLLGDIQTAVTGVSWMDKEISSGVFSKNQVGWDWFSLQLESGIELMVFQLRDRSGGVDYRRLNLIDSEGNVTLLTDQDWAVDSLETWTSPESSARYPLVWRLRIPGHNLDLLISPILEDQENRSRLIPGLNYWEGSVEVRSSEGEKVGQGFIELTGYGDGSRLPL